ncbi:MAG: HAMP domain-containing protein [Anaerolineae bacterium]|nr:HAMP domain-containing protein [Anaerolineae bacterium]
MNTIQEKRSVKFGGLAVSVLLPFTVSLALFYLLLRPAAQDFNLMVRLMSATMLISIVVAFTAYRLGWLTLFARVQASLVLVYALAGVLVFINVWVTARMMFASQHDLMLATVLLVFASGIAMAITYFLTSALTDRVQTLEQAAGKIAKGELTTRVEVSGRDEIASLAASFNQMAQQLESSQNQQRELEGMRRNLVAWVGHDLRTPLTSIRAILEALGDGVVEDPAQVQRYLRTAQQDIRSLSHLIDDLFELSQMDAGGLRIDCQPNALNDLISDTVESSPSWRNARGCGWRARSTRTWTRW